MSSEMTVQDAAVVISGAFSPLRCFAEPWDGSYRVRFWIFDESEEAILRAEDLLRPQVTDPRRLESIINQARGRLIDRGYVLDPWVYPGNDPGAGCNSLKPKPLRGSA